MTAVTATRDRSEGAQVRVRSTVVLCVVSVICALYMFSILDRGWVPHDEGAFAQSAERVLAGELPHRDFAEIYTGGLTYLNAFAFKLWGVKLISLRWMLFVFFVAWIPAVYYVATRFVPAVAAGAVTLLAVAWSVPTYPAAVPSWYNLFFAVIGVAALLRFVESRHRGWLFAAGVCGGLSILAKIAGLYYVAAVLLFLAFHEQERARAFESTRRSGVYSALLAVGVLGFVLALAVLVRHRFDVREVVHFVVPGAAVAALVVANERRAGAGSAVVRIAALWRIVTPFVLGVAVPVAAFLVPYIVAGAVEDLVYGVFVLPAKRFAFAAMRPPPLGRGAAAVFVVLLAVAVPWIDRRLTRRHIVLVGLALLALLALMAVRPSLYRMTWHSVRPLVPVVVVVGVLVVWLGQRGLADGLQRERVFLLLAATALVSLVQFPFSAPVYFCYVAPIVVLALCALLQVSRRIGPVVTVAGGFYFVFAVLLVHPGTVYNMGIAYRSNDRTATLDLPRGGLRVSEHDRNVYRDVVTEIGRHSLGRPIFVTPDAPEVYFLSGARNPTPVIFDFFDPPGERPAQLFTTLARHDVNVVVINTEPSFSGRIPDSLDVALRHRYPFARTIGRFQVRWKL